MLALPYKFQTLWYDREQNKYPNLAFIPLPFRRAPKKTCPLAKLNERKDSMQCADSLNCPPTSIGPISRPFQVDPAFALYELWALVARGFGVHRMTHLGFFFLCGGGSRAATIAYKFVNIG